jgi:hypothetical protein
LEDSLKAWRACYRHSKIPASLDCAACGKPICRDCLKESGDPALCPACKEAAASRGKALGTSPSKQPRPRRTPLTLSEVTIHDDGRVETPRDDTMKTPPKMDEEQHLTDDTLKKKPGPDAETEGKENTKELDEKGKGKREAARKRVRAKTLAIPAVDKKQLEAALPYGIAACVGVLGFWLLLALIRHSWTQTAVLTTGIVVPWVLIKGSTVKKKMGIKIWKGTPHPAWMGLLSVGIMLPLVTLAEFLAYKISLQGTHPSSQSSKFVPHYFNWIGVLLVVGGFVLAFGIPYLLRIGEGRSVSFEPGVLRSKIAKIFKGFRRRAAK